MYMLRVSVVDNVMEKGTFGTDTVKMTSNP